MKIKIIVIIFLFINIHIFSADKEFNWNISNNFNNSIYIKNNVELNYVNNTPVYYSLKKEKFQKDIFTDLYLSFDKDGDYDETGNYKIIRKNYHKSKNKAIYDTSAYFIVNNERIELISTGKSFFQSGINLGSFSISFWIYTSTFSNNETILKIGSEYYDKNADTIEDQSIIAKMIDGKLIWEFNNIFSTNEIKVNSIKLESYNRIIPEKWANINLIYDSYTGIIREYINGDEEGIILATSDKTLNSTVLNLKFNKSNQCIIMLAPSFYGAIDEFFISKKIEKNNINKYISNNGEIISKVEDFGHGGVFINDIITNDIKENNSDIIYYYRYSNKPFDVNDEISKDIIWKKISTENISLINIRFFQWKVILLSGDNRNYTSKFQGIKIKYKPDDPPAKPFGVKIILENDKLLIKWKLNSEKDLKGYKIYYGIKSNNYFGSEANQGESPIDVGLINTFEITGLHKSEIYYFSITAYDDEEHIHESDFSDEISIRFL